MYLVEELSAAKIAKAYQLRYASSKTAESIILYQLKKNGIVRRSRTEHVNRPPSSIVDSWVGRYVAGESLSKIAGDDYSPVTVWNYLRARGVQLRNRIDAQIEAVARFQKLPFDADTLSRAYLIGLRVGDLDAVRHGRAIRARVSTTHPAMMELFNEVFAKYSRIRKYPRTSPLTQFEWDLECDLDNSFDFLLDSSRWWDCVIGSDEAFLAFLAGFFDADGSVYYHKKGAHGGFEFSLSNSNGDLLRAIGDRLQGLGFTPSLRKSAQSKERGVANGGGFIWRLSIWKYHQVTKLLRKLPLRHREKTEKRSLALSLPYRATSREREMVAGKWSALKASILAERDACISEAAQNIARKHE